MTNITWPELIRQISPQFNQIALHNKKVRWEEELQFAIQSLQKNELLTKCSPHTVQNAIINVAAVGLTLNPADGYAYLVPEFNKKLKTNECHLRISFKGLIKNATDTGSINWVKAEIVKESDEFEYTGPCTLPIHKMNPFAQDRGAPIGVYCVAKTNKGDYLVDLMDWQEVQKIKKCAKTQFVWEEWEEEMAKKSLVKRAAKMWPKTDQSSLLHKTIDVMNEVEGIVLDDPIENARGIAKIISDFINNDDPSGVAETWRECDEQEQQILWKAKTKGGFFTQDEKTYIRNSLTEVSA